MQGYQGKEYRWRTVQDVMLDAGPRGPHKSSLHIRALAPSPRHLPTSSVDINSAFLTAFLPFSHSEKSKAAHVEGAQNEAADSQIIDLDNVSTDPSSLPSHHTSGPSIELDVSTISKSSSVTPSTEKSHLLSPAPVDGSASTCQPPELLDIFFLSGFDDGPPFNLTDLQPDSSYF